MPDPIPSLADARRLVAGATDGPWEAYRGTSGVVLGVGVEATEKSIFEDQFVSGADAEFIAASRTLVPALLAAVEGVLAVHVPGVAYGVPVCTVCSQVKDADEWDDPDDSPVASWLPWPCPTVRAITAHVRIEEEAPRG